MWWLLLAVQVQPMLDLTWTGGSHAYTFHGWDINSDGYADAVVSYATNGFDNDSVAIYLLPNNTHAVTYAKGAFPSVDVVGTWGNGRVLLEYSDWNNGTFQVEVMDNYTQSVFQSPVFTYQGYAYVGIRTIQQNAGFSYIQVQERLYRPHFPAWTSPTPSGSQRASRTNQGNAV